MESWLRKSAKQPPNGVNNLTTNNSALPEKQAQKRPSLVFITNMVTPVVITVFVVTNPYFHPMINLILVAAGLAFQIKYQPIPLLNIPTPPTVCSAPNFVAANAPPI